MMIYTCTMNLAIDLFIKTAQMLPSEVNRTDETVYMPNGKGVNVSFILKELGIDSVATGFKAGFTGQFIEEELQKAGKHNSSRRTELLVSMCSRKSWPQTKNSNLLTKVQVLHPKKKRLF